MQNATRLTLVNLNELESDILNPIFNKLDSLEVQISKKDKKNNPKFYRNKDLKELFGFSSNTIIKYRESGIIPYTTIGEIYLYSVEKINELLSSNSSI